MFVGRNTNDNISSLSLLKIKLEAALKFNQVITELDLLITIDDQLKDFRKMVKASANQSTDRYQIFWSQQFAQSKWGYFIDHHDIYIKDMKEVIESLKSLKEAYNKEWEILIGSDSGIQNNDFYKQLTNEITKAEALLENLYKFDIKEYRHKSSPMMKLAQKKLPYSDNTRSDKSIRHVFYRTQERELYIAFRKMVNAIKNISTPLIEDIRDEATISKTIHHYIDKMTYFSNALQHANDPAEINSLENRYKAWTKENQQDLSKLLQIKEYLMESAYITYDFILSLKKIEDILLKKIDTFSRSFTFNGHNHRALLLNKIVAMIKSHQLDDLDHIYSALKHDSYGINHIKGLKVYLEYLKMARDRNIDYTVLLDHVHIHDYLSARSLTQTEATKINNLDSQELTLLLNFDKKLTVFNAELMAKKSAKQSPALKL